MRWFGVDHPAPQSDKLLCLERLKIDVSNVHFVAVDFNDGDVDSALLQAGWEPDALSLMLCEGLAVYLDARALETLLKGLRALATVGTRLAISMSLSASDPARSPDASASWRRSKPSASPRVTR